MKIRIRSEDNGTYFVGWTGIGPCFGGTWEKAVVFDDGWDAYRELRRFPLVVDAELVNEEGESCDVKGRVLREEGA